MARPKKSGARKQPKGGAHVPAGSHAAKRGVLISVEDSHMGRISEVAEKCRDAGLDISHVMNLTGTITGSVEASRLQALKEIDGVAAVEPEGSYQLPPPDS